MIRTRNFNKIEQKFAIIVKISAGYFSNHSEAVDGFGSLKFVTADVVFDGGTSFGGGISSAHMYFLNRLGTYSAKCLTDFKRFISRKLDSLKAIISLGNPFFGVHCLPQESMFDT